MECFPGDDLTAEQVKGLVVELWAAELIECFNHNGGAFLQVRTWEKHQKIDRPSYKYGPLDETGRPLPFDEDSAIDPREFDERSTSARRSIDGRHPPEWNGMESKGMEGKGRESICPIVECSTTGPAAPITKPPTAEAIDRKPEPPRKPDPVVLVYPCNGKPATWELRQSQVAHWREMFPELDIPAECRAALAWVEANHKKTASGMPRYLVSWLGRSNDRLRARGARSGPGRVDLAALEREAEQLMGAK